MNSKHPHPASHEGVSGFLGPVSSPSTVFGVLLHTLLQAVFLKGLSSTQRGLKDDTALNSLLPSYVLSSKWRDVDIALTLDSFFCAVGNSRMGGHWGHCRLQSEKW